MLYLPVGVTEVQPGVFSQQSAEGFVNRDDISFHLALGIGDPARIDKTAEMMGHLRIAAIDDRIVQIGLDDAAFEIVEIDPLGHAAEKRPHVQMGGDKRSLILAVDKLHILVAAPCQGADKGIDLPMTLERIIPYPAHIAVIDLDFLARLAFDATGSAGTPAFAQLVPAHPSFERAVADPPLPAIPLGQRLVNAFWLQRTRSALIIRSIFIDQGV